MDFVEDLVSTSQHSRYVHFPEYIEVVFDEHAPLPTGADFHQELGSKFAAACQDLGAKVNLEPATLADAYTDPVAYDAHGDEVDMLLGFTDVELPLTFRFQRQPKKCHLMVGLKGAGKTSIINKLKMSVGREVLCSLSADDGFSVEILELDDFASISAWDLPASEEILAPWRRYLTEAVSLIFVVDSSDLDSLDTAQAEIERVLQELDTTSVKVVLIYANKQDLASALSASALAARLDIPRLCAGRKWFIQSSCAVVGDGVYHGINQLSRMHNIAKGAEEEQAEPATASDNSTTNNRPAPEESKTAELVLECIHNDGVDVMAMPPSKRTMVFQLDSDCEPHKECKIGRLHQPGFFEDLVPHQERLLSISRAHFLITASCNSIPDGSYAFTLKHMSKNPLVLDNTRTVSQHQEVPVGDGTWIGVKDLKPGEGPFLVLRISVRTRGEVAAEGSLFSEVEALRVQRTASLRSAQGARTDTLQAAKTTTHLPMPLSSLTSDAVLECTFASGRDIGAMPRSARSIGLPLDTPLEIGRLHQPGFFEYLLGNESRWLPFLARKHCELTLSSVQSWWGLGQTQLRLAVENQSSNTLFLDEQMVAKDEWDELGEGGTLAFAGPSNGLMIQFLKFSFRKLGTCEPPVSAGARDFENVAQEMRHGKTNQGVKYTDGNTEIVL